MNGVRNWFNSLNILYRLIVVILAVYLFYVILALIDFLFISNLKSLFTLFVLPSNLGKFILKPWSLFTYMFVHFDFWHILLNLITLYFSGMIFLQFFEQRQLWRVFVFSGLVGGLFYLVGYNIFPVFKMVRANSLLLGASAGITGIILAAAVYRPNFKILFFGVLPLPLWAVAALLLLIDLSYLPQGNAGGHLSHLGGAFIGALFGFKMKQGQDITTWLIIKSGYRPKMKVHKRYTAKDYRPQDYQWNKSRKEIRDEIDRILEKIAKHGYDSLTKKEREFLRRHSKDYDGFYG